tara:strand:- start:17 stop:460 length:444 start_codon:yes stop_codon:yes gene_type:complete
MINYQSILNNNMLNVLKDILKDIKTNGLSSGNHLYITFLTNNKNVTIPKWLKDKFPQKMTIVIQYEYYDLEINKKDFSITLSFNNVKTKLKINYKAIVSFADPSANFGLIIQDNDYKQIDKNLVNKNKNKNKNKDNVLEFSNYKKLN